MAARTPHPILSAAPTFDDLAPLDDARDLQRARTRDQLARAPFDAAADRFVRTPGPAETIREAADNCLSHGERTFAAGIAGFGLAGIGLSAASTRRSLGIC